MDKISVVINTLNEEKDLPRALKSVSWADEILVVDMYSEDKTVEIAKAHGASVFSHKRTGYVEPARNFAISKATGEWILVVDADEEIPTSLAKKLREIKNYPDADYYSLPRKNIIFGKWLTYSRWWPDYNIRFFKKGSVEWVSEIHSVPLTHGKGADLPADENMAIVHHNYESVSEFVERLNNYSSVQANEQKRGGRKFSWKSLIRKPTGEFLSRYFMGKGYKDGVHGLALSLLQAFSELVVELKLWELSKFSEKDLKLEDVVGELKSGQREINYWTADALYNEQGKIIQKLKRKLRLP